MRYICVQHGAVQVTRLNVFRRYAFGCVVIENIKKSIRHSQHHRCHSSNSSRFQLSPKSKTSNSLWIPRVTAARQAPKRKHKNQSKWNNNRKGRLLLQHNWREIEIILQFISTSKSNGVSQNVYSHVSICCHRMFHESVWVSKWWRKLTAVRASSQLTKINKKLKQNRNERRNWLPSTNPHL